MPQYKKKPRVSVCVLIMTSLCLQILKLLLDGQRLPPPPGCPRRIYKLIIQCW